MKEMLHLALELEGLLRVAQEREPDAELTFMIQTKAYALADLAAAMHVPEVSATPYVADFEESSAINDDESSENITPELEKVAEAVTPDAPHQQIDNTDIFESEEGTGEDEEILEAVVEFESMPQTSPRKPVPLSINDRFRFKRTLFNNSDEELNRALSVIEQLSCLEDAEDYLYTDLSLNPDNIDVQSFVSILDRYFR